MLTDPEPTEESDGHDRRAASTSTVTPLADRTPDSGGEQVAASGDRSTIKDARNMSSIRGGALGSFDPDEENQDPGGDESP